MVKPAPPTPWRARAFHFHRNQTFRRSLTICRADPWRTPEGLPARFRIRRVFFALAFLARLNVPFTVRAHPFMARQCSSTARLRQQLVLAGPLRATRARLQPTSSTFVGLAPVDSGYSRPIARWPKPAGFLFCRRRGRETSGCSAKA